MIAFILIFLLCGWKVGLGYLVALTAIVLTRIIVASANTDAEVKYLPYVVEALLILFAFLLVRVAG